MRALEIVLGLGSIPMGIWLGFLSLKREQHYSNAATMRCFIGVLGGASISTIGFALLIGVPATLGSP